MEDRALSSSANVMNPAMLRYEWSTVPWPRLEATVFKLQKRIYQASRCGNGRLVRRLQRLLLASNSAKLLAVRRVTQDNRGKKTAGIDGVVALTPEARMELASNLSHQGKSFPVRRVWIPKPGKTEKRPLGIPVIRDRARQALVRLALEPEWEARFEPNSYGFRPGRSCHDAIEAIFTALNHKSAYVLDADIAGCYDNIDHKALLNKLATTRSMRRVVKGWLKAGVLDGDTFQKTETGTPQGGVISPLLANVALHGLERETKATLYKDLGDAELARTGRRSQNHGVFSIIRYADDFVVLHRDKEIILKARDAIEQWLAGIGLTLKPSKTRITHTLNADGDEPPGFDFLGFNVRQYSVSDRKRGCKTLIKPTNDGVKRHLKDIRDVLRGMRGTPQDAVIRRLNPIVKGWSRYYCTSVARKMFERADHQMHQKLWRWAIFRHPHKGEKWVKRKYFRKHGGFEWRYMTHEGAFLIRHGDHQTRRHTKVKADKSPFDGDWTYWATRRGKYPSTQPRVATLIKEQHGRCDECHRPIGATDLIEVHHADRNRKNNARTNLSLLHAHCHDDIHRRSMDDNHQATEEPDESKGSRPVLEPGGEGRPSLPR